MSSRTEGLRDTKVQVKQRLVLERPRRELHRDPQPVSSGHGAAVSGAGSVGFCGTRMHLGHHSEKSGQAVPRALVLLRLEIHVMVRGVLYGSGNPTATTVSVQELQGLDEANPYFCVDAERPGLQAQYGRMRHPGLAALPGSTAVGELRDPAHLSQVPCSELAFVPLERGSCCAGGRRVQIDDEISGGAHSQVPHRPESQVPVICDYGSGFSKLGFAGCEAPYAVFPTVPGKLRHDTMLVGMEEEDWFIGDEVQNKRGILNLQYPISQGAITNWDNMEKIWHHCFYHVLSIAPEEHPLMVTEPPLSKTSTKEKVTQVLFETFGVPALYIGNQGVLSLYSSGQTSGTTIESGEGMTYFVPIIDGCPLLQSTTQMNVAGQDLTMYLMQLLAQEGNLLVSTGDPEFVRDIKEKCCYVALDFNKEKSKDNLLSCQNKFLLPDGQEITLRQEHFLCPEVLFQPSLIERNSLGMPMTVFRCISSCHPRQWKTLFHHIILSGGTGSCSGLRSRLQREIANLVCPAHDIQVYTSPYAKYGAWVGGSILCSLSTFEDMWVTNKEYEDMGSSVVRRRSI
nr:actin, larval muscle-type-like [Marmota flaviventris]